MRKSLLSVAAVALGLATAGSVPAAAGPIGLLPGPGSLAMISATSSVTAPGIDRVVFLLNGGSFSGIWSGAGGASICTGCFVGAPGWEAGGGNPMGFGGTTGFGGGASTGTPGSGGFDGRVTLPALLPTISGNSFTLPFELFGTLNGFSVFGQGQLLFTSGGGGGGLATGAPFQSSEAPEPTTLVLLTSGASALFLAARRRRKKA